MWGQWVYNFALFGKHLKVKISCLKEMFKKSKRELFTSDCWTYQVKTVVTAQTLWNGFDQVFIAYDIYIINCVNDSAIDLFLKKHGTWETVILFI